MKHHYRDIRDRLGEPLWYDEVGVPRYEPFEPDSTSDIYADEAALLDIECQQCGEEFTVCSSRRRTHEIPSVGTTRPSESGVGSFHYGDPPNTGCCPGGATMNSVPRRVREYWCRKTHDEGPVNNHNWHRHSEHEVTWEGDNGW